MQKQSLAGDLQHTAMKKTVKQPRAVCVFGHCIFIILIVYITCQDQINNSTLSPLEAFTCKLTL